jgi:hypothetical protein
LVVLGEMYRFFWGSLLLPLLLLLFLFTRSQSNARRGRQPKGLYKSGPETNRKRSLFYQSPPFLKRVVRFWGPCFLTPSFKQRSFLPPALFFGWLCALGFWIIYTHNYKLLWVAPGAVVLQRGLTGYKQMASRCDLRRREKMGKNERRLAKVKHSYELIK